MVKEEQLQSATEHLTRAKHEQPSLSLGDDLLAAKLSLDVLERQPGDLSAQRIYNFMFFPNRRIERSSWATLAGLTM